MIVDEIGVDAAAEGETREVKETKREKEELIRNWEAERVIRRLCQRDRNSGRNRSGRY